MKKIHPQNQLLFCFSFPEALPHPRAVSSHPGFLILFYSKLSITTKRPVHCRLRNGSGQDCIRAPGDKEPPADVTQGIPGRKEDLGLHLGGVLAITVEEVNDDHVTPSSWGNSVQDAHLS